jgi:excisionase family DNA binding protein
MKIDKFYGIRELAEALNMSQDAARDLLWRRKLAYRKIGGRLRVSESDLEAFLARTRVAAHGEAIGSSKKAT